MVIPNEYFEIKERLKNTLGSLIKKTDELKNTVLAVKDNKSEGQQSVVAILKDIYSISSQFSMDEENCQNMLRGILSTAGGDLELSEQVLGELQEISKISKEYRDICQNISVYSLLSTSQNNDSEDDEPNQ